MTRRMFEKVPPVDPELASLLVEDTKSYLDAKLLDRVEAFYTNDIFLNQRIKDLEGELEGMWAHIRANEKYIEKLDQILTAEITRH